MEPILANQYAGRFAQVHSLPATDTVPTSEQSAGTTWTPLSVRGEHPDERPGHPRAPKSDQVGGRSRVSALLVQ